MTLYEIFINPFVVNEFMPKAIVCCLAMTIGFVPLGLLLIIRRMSLVSDSMSHAILPGAAIGYFLSGTSLLVMVFGGIVAGLLVAFLSTIITRMTNQEEDASFASFYIISIALGVMIIALKGSDEELLHILFGDILSISTESLILAAVAATITLLCVAIFYRAFIIEFVDDQYMKASGHMGAIYHYLFLVLVVINLVSGFRALGTLMSVGLMLLPAMAARFWSQRLEHILLIGYAISIISSYSGLLISYHYKLPTGPAIILICAVFYIISVLLGTNNSIRKKYITFTHLKG